MLYEIREGRRPNCSTLMDPDASHPLRFYLSFCTQVISWLNPLAPFLCVCACVWQAEVQQRQWRRVENECHSFEPCISCMQLSRCRPLLHAHGKWQEKWAVGQLDRWGVSGQVNYNLHCLSVLKPPSTSYGRVKGFSNIQLSPHFGQRIA